MAERSESDRVGRALLAVTLATALSTTTLAATGVVAPPTAVLLFVAVEVPLTALTLVVTVWRYRRLRRAGHGRTAALEVLAGAAVTRVVRTEATAYRSLWLWARRRADGQAPGVDTIGYARGSLGVPLAFGVLTIGEAVAIDLLVPWAWLRTLILLASVYSLILLFGFVASRVVHPHLLTSSRLILRDGIHIVTTIDRGDLARAVSVRRYQHTTATEAERRLYLPSQDGTNVDLHFATPIAAYLPGLLPRQRRQVTITAASVHVDDPQPFLDLINGTQRDPSTRVPQQ